MKIYLLRHGITDACLQNTKMKDVHLSELGKLQIMKIKRYIPNSIEKIYSSPTLRTMETAKIINKDLECPILTDLRLKNKLDENFPDYFQNISSFIKDLEQNDDMDIVLVTHGRIIKMMYSIINFKKIEINIIDKLNIDYGDLFCIDKIKEKFYFNWKKINDNHESFTK